MTSILADTQYHFDIFYNTDTRHVQLQDETISKINYLAQKTKPNSVYRRILHLNPGKMKL